MLNMSPLYRGGDILVYLWLLSLEKIIRGKPFSMGGGGVGGIDIMHTAESEEGTPLRRYHHYLWRNFKLISYDYITICF